MDKLVSIVLPTYNGEKYIQESIESILCQTYKNWELIIVNDCSQDNTLQIINEYAQKDSRIRIINNEVNKKLPASLNIGFENAQGDYYTWTSDDNMYKPEALMYMSEFLDNNPQIALIACDFDMVQEGNEDKITKYSDTNPDNRTVLGNIFCSNIGACFMYRKEIAQKIGKYDEKMFCAEDLDYWCRLMLISEVHYSNENFYTYRFTKTSLTATRQKEIKARVRDIQEKYAIPVMKKLGLSNKETCRNLYKLHKQNNSIKLLLEIYKINLFYALYYTLKSLARIIIQKTFSIKNVDNKKVITILGFKIKLPKETFKKDLKINRERH